MGFFASAQKEKGKDLFSKDLLYANRCKVCTLNHVRNKTPKMQPTGTSEPVILFIGEAPGADEDIKGEQFVGVSGQLLRPLIPEKFFPAIRWDNAVRCRPPANRTPTQLEIDCCYMHHVDDLNATKPFAIFGFGNVPLQWAINQTGITRWRGRYLPVKLGEHVAWYFPFFHPSGLLRQRAKENVESNDEFATKLDLTRAFELVNQLPDPVVWPAEDAKHNITCITGQNKGDLQEVIKFLAYASTKKYAGFDYETQNLRPYAKDSRILTIGISIPGKREYLSLMGGEIWQEGCDTFAFAFEHPQAGWSPSELELVRDAFCDFLLSPCHKVVHNVSFEQEWTAYFFGRDKLRATNWEDTIIQAFVLDERPNSFSLEFLSIQYFGLNLKKISDNLNKKALQKEPLEDVLLYNGMDAKFHYLLFFKQQERIKAEKLQQVYDMQLRRVPTLVLTQMKGLSIDFEANRLLSGKFLAKIEQTMNSIKATPEYIKFRDKAGHDMNPGSTHDVEILLRDVIKFKGSAKTATGRFSTDEDALSLVDNPIAQLILDYRKAVKSNSTYIEPYNRESPKTVVHDDGLVHTILNSIFTTTGRLSSDSPNMQNISKRDSELAEVRLQFIIGE